MPPKFKPIVGAQGYQQSNPSVLTTVSLLGSLQVFKAAGGMPVLRQRSKVLTAHLERLLKASPYFIKVEAAQGESKSPCFTIITPDDPESRGAQLSLLFLPLGTGVMQTVFANMQSCGVVGDERQPDVIRLTPAPLYNEMADCSTAVEVLNNALTALSNGK
jgi:kynureninase